jgi:nitroimidazol reductase NimA-like FMN-containing flavoprotein (pyridoxamine 5'-phosphate oxidase superfamily)
MPPTRPRLPDDYGVPKDPDGLLAWEFVDERLRAARVYWITTVGPENAPHARPINAVWVDGALCFGGSPGTRWVRNLRENPRVSVHLAGDDEVVILEGAVELVADAEHPVVAPAQAATRAKHPEAYGDEEPAFSPFWILRPTTVYAWSLTGFPGDVTVWRLD